MHIVRPGVLVASLPAVASLLSCFGGLPHQRQARTAAAAALACPEDNVEMKSTSSQVYYATGCSAGVHLVCVEGASETECKPGVPSPLVDSPPEFCETYETPATLPEPPSQEEYAAIPHQGMLSQGLIREQVDKHMGLVRACFGCAERRRKGLSGVITAHLFVMPSGRMGGVAVTTDPFQDEALTQCVANVVAEYVFPPPGGNGPVLTSVPFRLTAP